MEYIQPEIEFIEIADEYILTGMSENNTMTEENIGDGTDAGL